MHKGGKSGELKGRLPLERHTPNFEAQFAKFPIYTIKSVPPRAKQDLKSA